MDNNLSLGAEDFKGSHIEKSFESDLEKAKKLGPLGPGQWVTIDGRHVYINDRGEVEAGKVYGKDGEDVKKLTGGSKGSSPKGQEKSGKGQESKGSPKDMSDKELNAAIKEAKAANDKASFADGSKNKTVSALNKLKSEKQSRTAAKKEAKAKQTKEKKKVDITAVNDKLYDMIQASGVKGVQMKADDMSRSGSDAMMIDIYGKNKDMAGMQIIKEDGVYEVSEYGAGPKGEDLLIFGEHKTLDAAVKQALKGNHTDAGQTPQKVLDGSDGPGGDLYKPFDKYKKEQDAKKSGGKKDEKMPINPKDWKDEPKKDGKSNKKEDTTGVITERDANPQDYEGAKHKQSEGYKSMSKPEQKKIDDLASTKSVDWNKVDPEMKAEFDEGMEYLKNNLNEMADDLMKDAEGPEEKALAKEFKKMKDIKDPLEQALAFSSSKSVNEYEYLENTKDFLLKTVAQIKKDSPEAFKTFNPNQTRLFKSRIIKALNRI